MIVIKLDGGLGNQMFQFAFASIIAKKNKTFVFLDKNSFLKDENREYTFRSFDLDVFDLDFKVLSKNIFFKNSSFNKIKMKLGLKYNKIFKEPSFAFCMEALDIKKPVYIKGYFQSYKYFFDYESFVRSIFVFPKNKIGLKNEKILEEINSLNSISIHIRRGDYINDVQTNNFHGTCSLNYYFEAINFLVDNTPKDIKLYFFSDDINWVKEKFKNINLKKTFIGDNTENKSWIDMLLMSKCKNNIIANSSFSWWGAWLNTNRNKTVIAPKRWFSQEEMNSKTKDLIPLEWIRM